MLCHSLELVSLAYVTPLAISPSLQTTNSGVSEYNYGNMTLMSDEDLQRPESLLKQIDNFLISLLVFVAHVIINKLQYLYLPIMSGYLYLCEVGGLRPFSGGWQVSQDPAILISAELSLWAMMI